MDYEQLEAMFQPQGTGQVYYSASAPAGSVPLGAKKIEDAPIEVQYRYQEQLRQKRAMGDIAPAIITDYSKSKMKLGPTTYTQEQKIASQRDATAAYYDQKQAAYEGRSTASSRPAAMPTATSPSGRSVLAAATPLANAVDPNMSPQQIEQAIINARTPQTALHAPAPEQMMHHTVDPSVEGPGWADGRQGSAINTLATPPMLRRGTPEQDAQLASVRKEMAEDERKRVAALVMHYDKRMSGGEIRIAKNGSMETLEDVEVEDATGGKKWTKQWGPAPDYVVQEIQKLHKLGTRGDGDYGANLAANKTAPPPPGVEPINASDVDSETDWRQKSIARIPNRGLIGNLSTHLQGFDETPTLGSWNDPRRQADAMRSIKGLGVATANVIPGLQNIGAGILNAVGGGLIGDRFSPFATDRQWMAPPEYPNESYLPPELLAAVYGR